MLGVVGGLLSCLVGVLVLTFVDTSVEPVPLPLGETVLVPTAPVDGLPVVVYGSDVQVEGSLERALGCVLVPGDDGDEVSLGTWAEPDVMVDGVQRRALVSDHDFDAGDAVRCTGPAAAGAAPMFVGPGEGDWRLAGILALVFGVFALLAGAVFMTIALALRASARRR